MRKRTLLLMALTAFYAMLFSSCRPYENDIAATSEDIRTKKITYAAVHGKFTKMRLFGNIAGLPEKKSYLYTYNTYAAVPRLDYAFLQKEMTDEEWEDFTLYFPLLKDGASFELTHFDSVTLYDKNGNITASERESAYCQYTSREMTDLQNHAQYYNVEDMDCGKIMELLLFDLDNDGVRELILQWTPRGVGDYLILRCENGNYYGLILPMRGFYLSERGVYNSGSGGNRYYQRLQFKDGYWM